VRVVSVNQNAANDDDLLSQVAAGHLDGLGVLFDRYNQPLRRFLSRLQVPVGDLDDLVQLTFLQVPRAAARFEPERSVKAWLFGLATVVVKRHRRTIARFARKISALAREPAGKAPPTPVDLVGEEQSVRQARQALADLSGKKREVFVMVVLEQLPGETVARMLGIPVGTVWTRLHHARRELRALLGEEGP
jgi:RNA polymerase sigma factor (sigma-70 family)